MWTIRFHRGRKRTIKTFWKERIRDQRCIIMCEITRSKTFGMFSKTCIWKQFAEKHSGLRITVRDNSIHKGMRRRNFRASGCIWYELQFKTRLDEDDGWLDSWTTRLSSLVSLNHFNSSCHRDESHANQVCVCMFFDSQCAADICFGFAQDEPMLGWQVLGNTFFACATSRHIYSPTEIMLGVNVQITRLHSVPLDSGPTTTLSNAGRSLAKH